MIVQPASTDGETFTSAFSSHDKLFYNQTENLALTCFNKFKNLAFYGSHKVAGIFVLPSQFLCFPSKNVEEKRTALKVLHGGEEIHLHALDGTPIHAMYFLGERCQKSSRTIIFFNANGVRYENYSYDRFKKLQKQGWNIVIFNYRNILTSKCMATCNGLVLDGEAVFHYIKNKLKVPESKILLHGHSLGGGVASEVAANHPFANYCNDRSFASLSKQVKVMFGNGIIGSIISNVLSGLGWEYDTLNNWDKIKGVKFVVYHDYDGIIPKGARLHEFLDRNINAIKMTPGKMSGNTLIGAIDNNKVIDDLLKNYEHPLKDTIELLFMNLFTGRKAHMRAYEEEEKIDYINRINLI